jgi:hypothetical protein
MPASDPPGAELPLRLTHADMTTARDAGHVMPLSAAIGWMACYRSAWWVEYEHGWLRVLDEAVCADLSQAAARLSLTTPEEE